MYQADNRYYQTDLQTPACRPPSTDEKVLALFSHPTVLKRPIVSDFQRLRAMSCYQVEPL